MRRDDWLLAQLPVAMTEDDFLARFVAMLQTISDSVLHHVDNVEHLVDVAVAPDQMVRAVGSWLGLDWVDPSLPDQVQRTIVSKYAKALLWRGTTSGLRTLLEAMTGAPVAVRDSGGVFAADTAPRNHPHVVIEAQPSPWITAADMLRIVRAELPAAVTFELYLDGALAGSAR